MSSRSSQLQLREVSPQLRALLWGCLHSFLSDATSHVDYAPDAFDKPWSIILKDEHIHRQHRMADDFVNDAKSLIKNIRPIFESGDYLAIFGWL